MLEYVNTRVGEYKGYIVAYRAPILGSGSTGKEEKAPIHVADVVKLIEESAARDRVGVVLVPHEDRSVGGEIGKSKAREARAGEYLTGVQGDRIPALVHDQI